MSTTAFPTVSFPTTAYSARNSDQITIIVASLSCLGLFVLFVLLVCHIYRKNPCCKSQAYQDSDGNLEAPSSYYNSRQTLVGSACTNLPIDGYDNANTEPGQLFYVGVPNTYCLPPLDPNMPRLPSYESVRKKDRQRQIHIMIADRFGLNEPASTEHPPTYEESVRHSLQSLVVSVDPTAPAVMPPVLNYQASVNEFPQNVNLAQIPTLSDLNNSYNQYYSDPQFSVVVPYDPTTAPVMPLVINPQAPTNEFPQNEMLPQIPISPDLNSYNQYYPEPQTLVFPPTITEQTGSAEGQMCNEDIAP